MKVLIFIEDGRCIRHFVMSGVFDRLAAACDVKYVFAQRDYERLSFEQFEDIVTVPHRFLAVRADRYLLWKRLFLVDQLRLRGDPQARVVARIYASRLHWKSQLMYRVFALPGLFSLYKAITHYRLAKAPAVEMEALLDEERPDVVVHPTVMDGPFLNDLVAGARRRGIPSLLIMNSWDNPSLKRTMSTTPDRLLVWGDQTWDHAVRLGGLPKDRVVKFGAAQFEVFNSPPRIGREEFCVRNDIDPAKTVLLYAGSTFRTKEYHHLEMLDEAIESGRLGNVAVLYRPHPWGVGGDGGDRILDSTLRHVRLESTMRSYLEGLKSGVDGAYAADYRDTHDVLASIDVLVSPLSTIILEAAMHGKPAMCFLPSDDVGEKSLLPYYRKFPHFQDLYAIPEFVVGEGTASLVPGVVEILKRARSDGFRDRLVERTRFFVENFPTAYGERLCTLIDGLVAGEKTVSP